MYFVAHMFILTCNIMCAVCIPSLQIFFVYITRNYKHTFYPAFSDVNYVFILHTGTFKSFSMYVAVLIE